MDSSKGRFTLASVIKVILIVLGVLIICMTLFVIFKVKIDSHSALRNAKNVRMSLQSADIEMYAAGKTIFNPSNKNGLEDGVAQKVETYADPKGVYSITAYDAKKHELTGMTYRQGNYVIYFTKKGEDVTWDMNLILNIAHYEESDVSGE